MQVSFIEESREISQVIISNAKIQDMEQNMDTIIQTLTKLKRSSLMFSMLFLAALIMAITTSYLTFSSWSCCRCLLGQAQ